MTLKKNNLVDKIYEARCGLETLMKCREHEDIDIVLLDVNMPDMDGIESAQMIKEQFPEVEIVAITMYNDEEYIRNMLKAGASGYVLKSAGKKDIIKAIENTQQGKPFYSEEVTFKVMKGYSSEQSGTNRSYVEKLTEREIEVLELIADEYTNQEIAEELNISKRTVDTHRTNLLEKTNSKNTAGLVRFALKNNLV